MQLGSGSFSTHVYVRKLTSGFGEGVELPAFASQLKFRNIKSSVFLDERTYSQQQDELEVAVGLGTLWEQRLFWR